MKMALYRKYRPKTFSDVVGQDAVAATLRNQVKSGRYGHSYIFTGIRGTGKTTFAKIFAKAVNCPNSRDGEPCGECEICRGIDDGSILDVSEIDAASNNKVDDIRALRDETAYVPNVCKMRVFIIDEAHMLSKDAWGALLKIMEEPPSHVLFILATTEIHKVPATILSRCQRFDLKRISRENIKARLLYVAERENIALQDDAAELIARLSDGAMRDALSLLDTCSALGGEVDKQTVVTLAGVADKSYLFELCDDLADKNAASLFERLNKLYENSLDATRLCSELLAHLRDLLMCKLSAGIALSDCSSEETERVRAQSERFPSSALLRIISALSKAADRMGSAQNKMLTLELCFIELCSAAGGADAPQAAAQPSSAVPTTPPRPIQPSPIPPAAKPEPAPQPDPIPAPAPETAPETIPERPQPQPVPAVEPEPEQTLEGQIELGGASGQAAPAEPEAEPEYPPFEKWGAIIEWLKANDGMMYGILRQSHAYESPTHVLIDADEVFMDFMRKNRDANDIIKRAISEVCGRKIPIGPYKPSAHGGAKTAAEREMDELQSIASANGLQVEIKEE